jgi:hypothetical protein
MHQIISEHALNNSQDIVLTPNTIAFMANIVAEDIVMKEEPNLVSHDSKFFVLMVKSSFINIYDSFEEENPSLLDVVVPLYMNSQPVEE